jgi:hypothetical protein
VVDAIVDATGLGRHGRVAATTTLFVDNVNSTATTGCTSSGTGACTTIQDGVTAGRHSPRHGDARGRRLFDRLRRGVTTNDIVGIVVQPGGGGYLLVGRDGGMFAFGDAPFFGSLGNKASHVPVVGIAA